MRHRNTIAHLGRKTGPRTALLKGLAASLITHERIVTTPAKAKAVKSKLEKLVTIAREDTVHHRRLAASRLPTKKAVLKLFEIIGPRYKTRPGGYLRINKLAGRRRGDAAEQVQISFVD